MANIQMEPTSLARARPCGRGSFEPVVPAQNSEAPYAFLAL